MKTKSLVRWGWGSFLIVTMGCTGYKTQNGGSQPVAQSAFDVNKYPLNKLVCDPLGGGTPVAYDQGLQAKLYSLKSGDPIPHDVEGMIQAGVLSTQSLFFSQINVPTRLFSLGFPTQAGPMVQNDSGQNLIEYFALRFEGGLRLADADDEGTYEFALLSDDGAIWSVTNNDNVTTTLVNNDGDHPTQMGCGQTLAMTHTSQYNMKLDYYQGPRYHISLIPMWRKVTAATTSEPLCGHNGNSLYFDYNNNSAPEQAYTDLLTRGWKPLTADNFRVPETSGYNPCATGTVPQITGLTVIADAEGAMGVTWTTDIASTSQVLYTNTATGVTVMTTADNVLRTNHSVVIQGLAVHSTYTVQAVSISSDLGKGLSAVQTVSN